MILTALDVSSLSTTLDRWEWAEYIAEAFVVLGCLGELVADIGEKWLRERRGKHLERWSTIVLILALVVSLTALVRTNELSGFVIGLLGDKANEADARAQTALRDSANASAEAAHAKSTADGADSKSTAAGKKAEQAGTSAVTALTIAGNARREADSFERDIASARREAADANEKLADRKLSDAQQLAIAQKLVSFAGQGYKVVAYWDSQESLGIANRIHQSLQAAHWTYLPPPSTGVALMGGIVGVQVWRHPDADESTKEAAKLLIDLLNEDGILAYEKVESPTNNPKDNIIGLSVGSKR